MSPPATDPPEFDLGADTDVKDSLKTTNIGLAGGGGALEVIGMAANSAKYGIATIHFYWVGAIPAVVFLGVFMMPFTCGSRVRTVPEYLKLPIGWLLSACGVLLGTYGPVTKKEMYAKSLGINLNVVWGVLMLAIGEGFLLAAFLKKEKAGR